MLNAIAKQVPWLIGGSADLAPSTKTRLTFEGAGDFSAEQLRRPQLALRRPRARHGRGLNGMSLSKLRAYGSGFLIFTDYARPAIRLSALMEIPTIYVFTHDSIGVGEDGPTHQPVEQLASLRAIPGLIVLRPADANEVAEAWRVIMQLRHEPVALVLTRQNLPTLDRSRYASAAGRRQGRLRPRRRRERQAGGDPDGHRQRGLDVRRRLRAAQGRGHRRPRGQHAVVGALRAAGPGLPRLRSSRPTSRRGWRSRRARSSAGPATPASRGQIIGMRTFGASAPLKELQRRYGFMPENMCRRRGSRRRRRGGLREMQGR